MIALDHIAVTGPDLNAAHDAVLAQTGLSLPIGGAHPQMGTHNRLCQMVNATYLELIAVDPEAPAPDHPRWFGLDHPPQQACLSAWILRTDDITRDLRIAAGLGIDLGQPAELSRGDLRWQISLRDDGKSALGGAAPILIEWPTGMTHPSANMADLGLGLETLGIRTAHADRLDALLDALGLTAKPQITQGADTKFHATLRLGGKKLTLS